MEYHLLSILLTFLTVTDSVVFIDEDDMHLLMINHVALIPRILLAYDAACSSTFYAGNSALF